MSTGGIRHEIWSSVNPTSRETHLDHRVAIIGAGPTGLRAAYSLIKRGYQVTLFDILAHPGGALVDAIPSSRLPRALITHDVALLQKLGVEFRLQTELGQNLSFPEVLRTFGAVLLATGTHHVCHLHISGETLLSGILPARQFLHAIAIGSVVPIGRNVVVIGGDRTAVFAARAALKAGARTVQIAFAGNRAMMTASADEVEAALCDGIQLREQVSARSFIGTEEATLQAVRCYETIVTTSKWEQAPIPKRVLGTNVVLPADMSLIAAGELPDHSFLPPMLLAQRFWPAINAYENAVYAKNIPGLFIAGGLLYGTGTIALALKHGEQAARMIDAFMCGIPLSDVPELSGDELALTVALPMLKLTQRTSTTSNR
ncbi:FAD-dependent oxidoreductase [Dictyobacter arantiisoli]|uniref:FAD/NAD(P)-binding domain-containing protein n=1 Tax=Dictyobacter arantiisoli TaxID=2014874 RepID=A0A5A5TB14_9CHLR|nr:FAD-dependent oxidoreductase [Dictyobacter arantiisoli]GCF08690.1 hypothetical protein KDI_22540 [Dictyobacter arantiisoli]